MVTVGSVAYAITANTQQFTAGIVASKAELRTLKDAFMATVTPVEQFATAISHLEGQAAKFPDKAETINRVIGQMKTAMHDAAIEANMFKGKVEVVEQAMEKVEHGGVIAHTMAHAMEHLGIVVDPVSAAFKVAEIGIESFHKVVEGAVETVHAISEKIESLNKLNLKAGALGIDPGELIGLAGAAKELTGLDFDSFTSMLTKFSSNLGQAAVEAKGPTFDAFQRLGLKLDELAKMPADEALKATAEALSKVSNAFERSFLAKEIGGKMGPQFVQFLAAGDEEITEITDHVKELEQTKFIDSAAIHEAAVAMEDFEHRLSGIMNLAASEFAPLFKQVLDDIDVAFGKLEGSGDGLKNMIQGLALTTAALLDELEQATRLGAAYAKGGLAGVTAELAFGAASGPSHVDRLTNAMESKPLADKAKEQAAIAQKAQEASEKSIAAERDKSIRADAALAIAQEKILIEQEKEAAKAKVEAEKERLSIVNRIVAEEGKIYAQNEQKAEAIAKAHQSGPEKLREEFEKIQELEKGGFFDLHPGAHDKAIEDLRDKAENMLDTGSSFKGITGAVTSASREGIAARFGSEGTTEKQLREQQKHTKEQQQTNTLLQEIRNNLPPPMGLVP